MSETLGEAIVRSHATIGTARAERDRLLVKARKRGVSVRDLAALLDVSPTSIMTWAPVPEGTSSRARLGLDGRP